MNILFVTPYVPSRIRSRPYNLIRELLRLGHQITLLTSAGQAAEERLSADELRAWGVHVELFPIPFTRSVANCLLDLFSHEPLQAVYAYHPRMEQRLMQLTRDHSFDLVHIEHLRAARLVRSVDATPTVYDSVDCISLLFEQTARISPQWRSRWMAKLDLGRTRRYEAWLLSQYDHVVITSDRDKAAMQDLVKQYLPASTRTAPITVVTNGVDLTYFQVMTKPRDPHTVVFTGKMSYHANVAAVLHFAEQVLPLIWRRMPEVRFEIVGKDPPSSIQKLARDPRIQVTGYVDDLRPYLAKATVAVCPIRYAVGVQFKVLEAMAMGTPTISTPAGCVALDVTASQQVMIAEGNAEFADAVCDVLSDPILAQRLSIEGRKYVEDHNSWEASARRLSDVYQQTVLRAREQLPTTATDTARERSS